MEALNNFVNMGKYKRKLTLGLTISMLAIFALILFQGLFLKLSALPNNHRKPPAVIVIFKDILYTESKITCKQCLNLPQTISKYLSKTTLFDLFPIQKRDFLLQM